MAKKVISKTRAAGKFGFLGAFIGLGITLFWPSIYPTTLIVNTVIGYCSGFIINYFFRMVRGK
jgi:putative flippase GtrA